MPIRIIEKTYTDWTGQVKTFYENNAGDLTLVNYTILEQIQVVSNAQNFLQFNLLENTITWQGGNWYTEGFRPQEVYQIRVYDANGNFIAGRSDTGTCLEIAGQNYNTIKFNDIDPVAVPNTQDGEYVAIFPLTDYRHEEIVISVNHVQTGTQGNEYSLIDGESTVFRFNLRDTAGFPFIPDGTTIFGETIGKQSGQFLEFAQLTFRDTTPQSLGYIGYGYVYEISYVLIQSGIYDIVPFQQNKCLKLFNQFEYARFFGEPFYRNQFSISDDANTGWFDEAYNVGVPNATLVQGITELAYDFETTGQIIVETSSPTFSDFAIGCSYVPTDPNYYKNKPLPQQYYGMTIGSTPITPATSPTNPVGANYTIEIVNITSVGTTHTIDFKFTPNVAFEEFMETRDEEDRLFYVWIFAGNINLLAFSGQLTSNPPVGGFLTLTEGFFYDHSANFDTPPSATPNGSGYEANKEDDLAFYGSFLLNIDEPCESFTARIEAFNTSTLEEFILGSAFFSFNSVPFAGGKHLLNLSQTVQNALPTTSLKRNAYLKLETSLDTPTQYGVAVYFPFLYRWENWIPQTNASVDFYPDKQTKDWLPYDTTGDWTIRVHLELVKNDLAYIFNEELKIKDYNSEPNIDQKIDLIREIDGTIVTAVIVGEQMRVRATHERLDGLFFDPAVTWGMITVEPTTASPRWICSTVVPSDNNPSNPLTPITGNTISITYTGTLAIMECFFNPSVINLEKGVKFTTKIKTGCGLPDPPKNGKQTTLGDFKETTTGGIKEIAL
jgi:hypothetical protein